MNKFFATILMLLSLTAFAQQTQTSQARANLDYGDRFWANQRYNEALPYYHEARRLAFTNPVDMQVMLSLTYRYLAVRDERTAWDCFDKVTTYAYQNASQNPDWSKGWLRESVNFYTQHLAGGVMRQAGTTQPTIKAFYDRAVWIQSFLAGNTTTTTNNGVTLAVSTQVVAPGGRIVVSFNAPGRSGKAQDWVSLYKAGSNNQTYLSWKHTGGQASGNLEFAAPNEAGRYEFRYLLDNGYTHVATSYSIEVRATAPAINGRVIDWNYAPGEHRAKTGQRFAYTCSPGAASNRIWGVGVYTDDSSLCTAAVHAGMIRPETGGTVVIEMRAGQQSYVGGGSNGVNSLAYGGYPGSYVFVR